MGTPEFAVASLDALCEAGCNIVGVVTAPDKPAGRGLLLQPSAVKRYATEKSIPLLQPVKLKDPAFLQALDTLKADLQVVVAFRMLPEVVWNRPPLGTINLHGSLLPQYRGAAPINWAIIDGNTQTGVSTFLLQHEIDTGQILLKTPIEIGPNETAGELHDKMKEIGAALLVKTVQGWIEKTIVPTPQSDQGDIGQPLRHAPKLTKETGQIDWQQPVALIHNLVRGLSPTPCAYTQLHGKLLKIIKSNPLPAHRSLRPGQVATDGKTYLYFGCGEGALEVLVLQLEGKKKMPTVEFLKGYRFEEGQ
ncbi:MAG: methionyl-tRNA formyltransferase [Chitinophagia bacterium]|nr:methionyl-tRNA formyltransferase [Chitinophagia bacterium]